MKLDPTGVSRDPAVVAAYLADPFVHSGKMSARLAAEMFDAMARAREGAGAIALPLLLQHGAEDRLTAPEGSRFLFDHVASTDKRLERSEEHTSELQSLMRISYAVFCLKKK